MRRSPRLVPDASMSLRGLGPRRLHPTHLPLASQINESFDSSRDSAGIFPCSSEPLLRELTPGERTGLAPTQGFFQGLGEWNLEWDLLPEGYVYLVLFDSGWLFKALWSLPWLP